MTIRSSMNGTARNGPANGPAGDAGQRARLVELLDELAVREGAQATAVSGVELARASEPSRPSPLL